jgi:hypothetical protein
MLGRYIFNSFFLAVVLLLLTLLICNSCSIFICKI